MNFLLDILFPKKCVGCGKSDSYFCTTCVSNIIQGELICPICGVASVFGETHPFCKRVFGLDGLWSLGLYQGSLKKAIQKLKYKPALVRDFAPVLVNIIVEYWTKYQPFIFDEIEKDKKEGWVVVPVPLFWFRENNRGFNQSSLIGQKLSKKLGLDYCEGLKRIRFTKSQVKLKGKERYQNIKNAFSVSSSFQPLASNILLVDDVWTTGSTIRECCYILKRAGAKKVWGITLAR